VEKSNKIFPEIHSLLYLYFEDTFGDQKPFYKKVSGLPKIFY